MTREEYARKYLENTDISAAAAITIVVIFLFLITAVPVYQLCREAVEKGCIKEAEILQLLPNKNRIDRVRSLWDIGKLFGSPQEIKDFEASVEEEQYFAKAVRPYVQLCLTGLLKTGNEKALTGNKGELFYSEELKALITENPDNISAAVNAVSDMKEYLDSRGIELIVMPVPNKLTIYPEYFSECGVRNLEDKNLDRLEMLLNEKKIRVCSLRDIFRQNKNSKLFLSYDTHWTPDGLELTVEALKKMIGVFGSQLNTVECRVSNRGDIFDMLQLPDGQKIYGNEAVVLYKPSEMPEESRILLLGDSYSNIYSDASLKWGGGAGLAELLSAAAGTRVEKIAINAGGASSSRRELYKKLIMSAREGKADILDNKKVVVYEFAEREIALGNWQYFGWDKLGKAGGTK